MDTGSRRTQGRIAAAVLGAILFAATAFTYLAYISVFSSTDKVTVTSPRAGLVMEQDAKVKYRGIQIGKVKEIKYQGDQAKLTLAIDSSAMHYIPSNAAVHIASNTIFGAKSVEFVPPPTPSGKALRGGANVQASDVQLEVNTLFQKLTDLLDKIDPVQLNGSITALAEGLRGNGDNLGALLSGLNGYLEKFNPLLPQLQKGFAKTAVVGNIYGDAAPDLATTFDNVPTISKTLVDQRDNLNRALLATAGLANNGYDTIAPGADDFIAGIQRFRALGDLLAEYSPEFGCLFKGIKGAMEKFGPSIGGTKPALYTHSNFLPGAPAYTYPESLPVANASGGPNCRGLPDIPSKQFGGSWFRSPFLVTDNSYIPFQPNTEVQFDAPSTAQFLFNGAYAERDEY
ncbi:MCE family protein [Mycolicibacter sp. MYC123]|uniref:MCE family protein n=1 Tax=[Mycobacterium] zoologicum TaxID=2872311 RepID=A0ABU5YHM6_9MYCO|nr:MULTISPECIES: MCE family protein [unclassified Mycolicibacter]MEB3048263.1 MCE family protein [Mycolicibacter sp. MYC123]MEB3064992.1 MCE family protein [Mycolicibacter sp. MYC101]